MSNGSELATGYVSITASAEGVGRAIVQQFQQAQQGAARAGQESGKKFSDAFGKLAGLATGAALLGAVKGAADAEQGARKLTAQLGLTADEAKRFGADAKELFANNFAGSIDEANDAIKSVVTNIGGLRNASDKDLTAIAGKVSSVAQTFDQDLGAVSIAVGQQLKTGLAKSADEALDNIAAGFQHGDDKAGDFLDTLNEYGVQFQKLGIDGTTATGLLSQGLQAGARDADLVADSLKEFSIRAVDGSATTAAGFTALGLNVKATSEAIARGGKDASTATEEVLTKMRAIEDPVQRAAVATELFGTQSEDLGKALFALDLDSAAKGLGNVAGAAQNVSDTVGGGTNASLTTFWQTLQTTGLTIGEDLLPQLTPALGILQDVGATAGGAVKFFGSLPGPIKDAALAFGAMVLLRGPLIGFFGQIQARAAAAAVSLAASNGIAGATGAAAGGLSRMAGVLGGPWGLAIGAGVAALISFASKSNDAKVSTGDFSQAIDDQTGALTKNADAVIAKALGDDGALKRTAAAGVAQGDLTLAVKGDTAARERATNAIAAHAVEILKAGGATEKGAGFFKLYEKGAAEAGLSLQDYTKQILAGGDARKQFAGIADFRDIEDPNDIQSATLAYSVLTQETGKFAEQQAATKASVADTTAAQKAQTTVQKTQTVAVYDSVAALAASKAQQDSYVSGLEAAGLAQDKAEYSARTLSGTFQNFAIDVDRGSQAAGAGAGSISKVSDEFVRLTPHARDAAESQGSWNRVMQDAKGVTDEETASLALFSFSVDQLSGRNRTAEEAAKNLNDQVRGIAAAFKEGTDATHGNIESLITASGAIDTTSEAGSKLYDQLNNYRTAADQSTDAAYESAVAAGNQAGALGLAQKAADSARAKFLEQASALGINKTAAEKMADQLGILEGQKLTDKNFDINAKDNASVPVADVQKNIDGLKDKTVTVTVNTLGQSVTTRPDGSFTTGSGQVGMATGGLFRGMGTGTSDSNLIRISDREGINTAAAMSHDENVRAMHFMNAGGVIPGFATGGLINVDMTATGNIDGALAGVKDIYAQADASAAKANADAAAAAARAIAVPQASSAGVEQWRALAMKVAAAKGEDPASVQVMLNQMARESGGNPAAINLTDSNAQAGHPSKGLLQFIIGTFNANADPGFNSNIYDPESQMHAWYNYINSSYGGWRAFTQRSGDPYGAYATGGLFRGSGTGTSDSNIIRISDREGINNAQAMSHSANVAAMNFMNRGGIIPGFANGGLVSAGTLAGNPAIQYGDRRSAINDGIAGMVQALAAETDRVADKRAAANRANEAAVDAAATRRQAKTAAEIKAADAQLKTAIKVRTNADTAFAAEKKNSDAAAATQKQLAGVYRNLQAAGTRFDQLTSRLDSARNVLADRQSTLAGTRQDKAQAVAGYASSIAGFDGGLTGHSDVRTTSGAVVNGRRYTLGKITDFYKDLATLRKRGASVGILEELTDQFGSGGEITAHALATGPLSDLKATEAFGQQISRVANAAGAIAPSLRFDPKIQSQQADVARQTANVATLTKALADTNKQLQTYAGEIDRKLIKAITGISVVLDSNGVMKLIHTPIQAAVNKAKGQR